MNNKPDIIVGLDIGTTKIAVIVAHRSSSGNLDVIGVGTHPSKGLRKGVVVNIEATVESIRQAVQQAEQLAGCKIIDVYAGIAGSHISGDNSFGVVGVKNREVTARDLERVIDSARALAIPNDREIIHILPQEYIIDDQDGIKEPLGMSGVRLEARVHIVTASVASGQNIVKCANRVGLNVRDIVLEPIASAEAVLTNEEKELGVALVDIGGGTTDLTIFHNGAIKYTAVIPLGGNNITNDIAAGLRTPVVAAEEIKKVYGCASIQNIPNTDSLEVTSTGGRTPRIVSRHQLIDIIQPRIEEIFAMVRRELLKSSIDEYLTAGIVLTGGSVLLEGLPDYAESFFNLPVRRGYPSDVGGLTDIVGSPEYATGVGLVLYGARSQPAVRERTFHGPNVFERVKTRMSDWFQAYF
ncbi:MAG: cell division protein FtsA [Deltaproteobacteria bacterium]|nr:cell division protein FtsA [Deltaproteobacteria bacterium]